MARERCGEVLHEFRRDFFKTGKVISVDFETYEHFMHDDVTYEVGKYGETVEVAGEQQTVRVVTGHRESPSSM